MISKSLFILFIIVLGLVNSNSNTMLNENHLIFSKNDVFENKTNISNEYLQLLIKYTNTLINNSENDNTSYYKWKKIFNWPSYEFYQYSFGLYVGAAGIGRYFLDLYKFTGNLTYLKIADGTGEYLITKAKETKSYFYWTRSEDVGSIYLSQKYGPAGIVDFLLNLYEETNNSTYLLKSEKALYTLLTLKVPSNDSLFWAYDYPGVTPIVDIMYGVTGIASTYLKAYQVTNNQTYLNICLDAMKWVEKQTETSNNTQISLRRILYTSDSTYPYYYVGYQSGASGIADFYLKIYKITGNSLYLDYTKDIANWLLLEEQLNGNWFEYNGVEFLTDVRDKEGFFTGFGAGSSGIGIFFMNLYKETKENIYLGPIERIKDYLVANSITNGSQIYWKVQTNGSLDQTVRTDISLGVAGVGMFFIRYYELFGLEETLTILGGIKEFYKNITTSDGLVPFEIFSGELLYDSSYFEGLTGITSFMLEVNKTIWKSPLYPSSILENIENLTLDSYLIWNTKTTEILSISTDFKTTEDVLTTGFTNVFLLIIMNLLVFFLIKRKRQ
jgi:lantibiotic modifying enzyme